MAVVLLHNNVGYSHPGGGGNLSPSSPVSGFLRQQHHTTIPSAISTTAPPTPPTTPPMTPADVPPPSPPDGAEVGDWVGDPEGGFAGGDTGEIDGAVLVLSRQDLQHVSGAELFRTPGLRKTTDALFAEAGHCAVGMVQAVAGVPSVGHVNAVLLRINCRE